MTPKVYEGDSDSIANSASVKGDRSFWVDCVNKRKSFPNGIRG